MTWTTPLDGFGLSVSWRYFGAVENDGLTATTPTSAARRSRRTPKSAAQNYFDLAATWRVKDNYTLRLGVNNIFDNDPPLIGGSHGRHRRARYNGNTYPGVYDALGRYMFMGVTADF